MTIADPELEQPAQNGAATLDAPVAERRRRQLLSDQDLAESGPAAAVLVPLDMIDPNPRNPRAKLLEVAELAESIKAFGLLHPVTIRRSGERYELIGGHRRWAAYLELHEREPLEERWKAIPATVVRFADDLAELAMIASQVHHLGWRPREEASALERLVLAGLTVEQIGQRLHRNKSWASKRLRVYSDAVLSAYVQTGKLPATVAEELLTITAADLRRDYADKAASESWSQSTARAEVRKLAATRQIRELGRQARLMLDLLSTVDASRIPDSAARDLHALARRIDVVSGLATARMPTIAQAERAAGVTERQKAKAETQRRAATLKKRAARQKG